MKILKKTGEIFINDGPAAIGPNLSRKHFLGTDFAGQPEPLVNNDPYFSYVMPRIKCPDTSFNLSLQFWDDTLQAVELVDCHPRFEAEAWCEDTEIKRKLEHERRLKEIWSVPPGQYGWGRVASLFDPRCGCSMIFITYGG